MRKTSLKTVHKSSQSLSLRGILYLKFEPLATEQYINKPREVMESQLETAEMNSRRGRVQSGIQVVQSTPVCAIFVFIRGVRRSENTVRNLGLIDGPR